MSRFISYRDLINLDMALGSSGSPNGSQPILLNDSQRHRRSDWQDTDKLKEDIGLLMVLAIMIAAVTFVMGFSCTKVYISSGPDLGITGLIKTAAFMVFLLCNSIPMLASFVALLLLLTAHDLTDFRKIDFAILQAILYTTIAFVSMLVAFMVGVCLVLSFHGISSP